MTSGASLSIMKFDRSNYNGFRLIRVNITCTLYTRYSAVHIENITRKERKSAAYCSAYHCEGLFVLTNILQLPFCFLFGYCVGLCGHIAYIWAGFRLGWTVHWTIHNMKKKNIPKTKECHRSSIPDKQPRHKEWKMWFHRKVCKSTFLRILVMRKKLRRKKKARKIIITKINSHSFRHQFDKWTKN